MQGPIPSPALPTLLPPLLSSLPTAAVSPTPPIALLPLLSPILRQRVQLLSSTSSPTDPWLPLLCYSPQSITKLQQLALSSRLEPHPVSGEVEIDFDYDISTRYQRVDSETLRARVLVFEDGLEVRLVWCVDEGETGWRIGEVCVASPSTSTPSEWEARSISEAETRFSAQKPMVVPLSSYNRGNGTNALLTPEAEVDDAEEEDDESYWAQYDNTPARTPVPKQSASPAPAGLNGNENGNGTEEEEYYAQYATVQPAMDNHDPDEALENGEVESSLGAGGYFHGSGINGNTKVGTANGNADETSEDVPMLYTSSSPPSHELAHPRPGSSTGSSGSNTVARLEREAAERSEGEGSENSNREKSEAGIKRHICASVKSLYRLARVAGIEMEEFQRIVRTELEVLEMMGEEEV